MVPVRISEASYKVSSSITQHSYKATPFLTFIL